MSFEIRTSPLGATTKIAVSDALQLLRSLESKSVDLIATDPAYNGMNKHLQLGRGRIVGNYAARGEGGKWFEEFDDSEDNYDAFLHECARVLRDDRHVYLMFDPYSLLTLAPLVRRHFDVKNLITWDKVALGMGHNFRRRSEFVLFCSKGKRPVSRRDMSDVWRISRVHRPAFPTQKPVELFEAMIAASGAHGGPDFVVCDPFVGSGSSAVAAHRQGCSFIGGDTSQAAIETALMRLDAVIAGNPDPLQPKPLDDDEKQKAYWQEYRIK